MIHGLLIRISHPEHWRMIFKKFANVLNSDISCVQHKLAMDDTLQQMQLAFAWRHSSVNHRPVKEDMLIVQTYSEICSHLNIKLTQDQTDVIESAKTLLASPDTRLQGLSVVYQLPTSICHFALNELDDPLVVHIMMLKEAPTYWLDKDINSEIKGILLQKLTG